MNHSSNRPLNQRLDIDFALVAAGLGVWEYDPLSGQVLWDEQCQALFGLAKGNILSYEEVISYIHPDDITRIDEAAQRVLDPQSDGVFDQTYRTIGVDDGQLRWVRFQGRVSYTRDGAIERYAGVAQEVTQQQMIFQQLEESRTQLRNVIQNSPFAMALHTGPALRIELANETMLGYWNKDASVVGKAFREAVPELAGQGFFDQFERVYTTGEPYQELAIPAQLTIGGQTGTYYFDLSLKPLCNEQGQVYAVLNSSVNVTPQVVARQQLQESELFARTLFEHSPIAKAVFMGPDMVIQTANKNMLAMWDRDSSVIGQPFMQAVPELISTPQLERLRQVLATGETFYQAEEKFTLLHQKGPYTGYYEYAYQALRSTSGAIYGVMSVASEVTQQVIARQQIEASEKILRELVVQAPIGISVLNAADLVIEIVNDTFVEVAGKPYEDLLGKSYWIPFAEAAPYYEAALSEVVQSGNPFYANETELLLIRQGKPELIYVTFVYMPLKDLVGKVSKVIVWVLENTHQVLERRKVEQLVKERTEELQDANHDLQRSNDNLQQFAYVASHDLQEPLRKIQSFGDVLKAQYGASLGDGGELLERMQVAAQRMATLIHDLLTFSRISTRLETLAPVALTGVLELVLYDLELVIEETKARVMVDPLPIVGGDKSQLGQLFQNLVANALKFRQAGVPPLVHVRCQQLAAATLPPDVRPTRSAEAYYQIQVIDNGIGFDQKYTDRIFQVFQRLHGRSQYAGTGIGLAICEKVAANHGGAITATSQSGQGATFSVYLPASST